MAAGWIKMSTDLRTHPKVVRIASALKADRLRVLGGLHAVWCLFDAHSEDGTLDGYTLEALDDMVGWPGFAAAMVAIEWIEVNPTGLNLPRFDTHNGASAKRRAQETDRKRLDRALSASDADEKRSREEKRREEKKEQETKKPARKRSAAAAQLVGVDALLEAGVEKQVADDWLIVRKAKTLPLTHTAWDGVIEEAAKANMTVPAAIKTAVQNGWGSFKAVWMDDPKTVRIPGTFVRPAPGVGTVEGETTPAFLARRERENLADQAERDKAFSPESRAAKAAILAKHHKGLPKAHIGKGVPA